MSKLVGIKTYERFRRLWENNDINEFSLNFILDTGQLYTHGIFINSAVFGTAANGAVSLSIAGTTNTLALSSHTHSNYYDKSEDLDITNHKIVSGDNDLLFCSGGTLYLGNTNNPTYISGSALYSTRGQNSYTILDTGNFEITNTLPSGYTFLNTALIKYGGQSHQIDYVKRINTSQSFDYLHSYTQAGTNQLNGIYYGYINFTVDNIYNNPAWAQLRINITGKTIQYRTSADANNWIDLNSPNISLNSLNVAGIVPAPTSANTNKVWKTDNEGNPGWRDEKSYIFQGLTFQQISGTNLATYDTTAARTILAGDNIAFSYENGIIILRALDTTYSNFVGASQSENGTAGLVIQPLAGDQNKYLRGDGSWQDIVSNLTASLMVGASNGTSTEVQSTNGNVHLIFKLGNNYRRYKIVGTGRASVTSDSNGNITINSNPYSNFGSASETVVGTAGLVPAPGINQLGSDGYYLRADGTWNIPTNTWDEANTNQAGYIPQLVTGGVAISGQTTEYVLTYVSTETGVVTPKWKTLPSNAFKDTWDAASLTLAGYVPQSIKGKYLHANVDDGSLEWIDDRDTTYNTFTGASATDDGTSGLVTTPTAGSLDKFLKGNGTWDVPINTWRNIYVGGTQQMTTSNSSKGLNLVAGNNISITYAAPGTSANQSGNSAYGNLTITAIDTWIAWQGASSQSNGTAGYMPAPTTALKDLFLRGDGQWVSLNNYSLPIATNSTLGGVKIGTTLDSDTGFTKVHIKDSYIYYHDTTYSFSNLKFLQTSGTDLMTYNSQAVRTILAGTGITFSHSNNILTISSVTYSTATASSLGLVKIGTTLEDTTGYTKVHIDKNGFIYYHDTTYSFSKLKFQQDSGTDLMTYDSLAVRTILAGDNITFTHNNNILTIKATNTWTAADLTHSGYVPNSIKGKFLHANPDTGALEWTDDNNTWKAANTSQEGYIPKLATGGSKIVSTDVAYILAYKSGVSGTTTPVWILLPDNAYNNTWDAFTAATATEAGAAGYIQAPAGTLNKFFRGDNTWQDVLMLSGGTMIGNITFSGDNSINWTRNTDSASISFKNTGDGDTDSYMSFVTADNGNEYFRFSHTSGTNVEWATIKSDGIRVKGTLVSLEGHKHPYTDLTGSTTIADLAIVSSGTANGWTLKTLGSRAFDSTAYLPLTGGTISNNNWGQQLTLKRENGTPSLYFNDGSYNYYIYPAMSKDNEWHVGQTYSNKDYILWHNGNFTPDNYLEKAGGSMNAGAMIYWTDWGQWGNNSATYPKTQGGLQWNGTSDWIKLFAEEIASDDLRLILLFGDDISPSFDIRNNSGTTTVRLLSSGLITAESFVKNGGTSSQFLKADGTVDSTTYLPNNSNWIPATLTNAGMIRRFGFLYSNACMGLASNETEMYVYTDGAFYQREGAYMCLDTDNYSLYALPLTGGEMTGSIKLSNASIIQKLRDTSNYTAPIVWFKGGVSLGKVYDPLIGLHNTGGTAETGSICILPYASDTDPWNSTIGLYISQDTIKWENKVLLHAGNYSSYVYSKSDADNRYVTLNTILNITAAKLFSGGITPIASGSVNTASGGSKLWIKKATASTDGTPNNGLVFEFGSATSWVGLLYMADNGTQGLYWGGWTTNNNVTTHCEWKKFAFVSDLDGYLTSSNTYVSGGKGFINGSEITTISGNATTAGKLSDTSAYTAWGRTFFTSGKPLSISGNIDYVDTITFNTGYNGRKFSINKQGSMVFDVSGLGNNGWATGYGASNSSAYLGGFGIFGSGTSLSYAYIGKEYNNNWMVILSSGNVGIGTLSPGSKLQVNGTGYFSDLVNIRALALNKGMGGTYGWIDFYYGGGSSMTSNIYESASGKLDINDSLYVIKNGSVGIGISSPSTKLDVGGKLRAQYFLSSWSASGTGGSSGYVNIADITVTGSWANMPLKFRVVQRGQTNGGEITIRFTNVDGAANASIAQFFCYGDVPTAFITRNGTVFSLYIQKAEAWDTICITGIDFGVSALSVEWKNGFTTSIPSSAIIAEHHFQIGNNRIVYNSTNSALKVIHKDGSSTANLYATNFYTTSDRNKKQNITIFSEHIRKFQLKNTEKYAYGVIAQEVEEIFRSGLEGDMSVNYNSVLSFYIGQLENRVKELEEKIKLLETK